MTKQGREKKKRIIFIGRSGAGKTTLCQRIDNQDLKYLKTQTVQLFNDFMIDTPGEYLEHRSYQGALLVSSMSADIIILVQDGTEKGTMFPPNYASLFTKPVIGVITKGDLAGEKQNKDAHEYLRLAGVQKIIETSSVSGKGISILIENLKQAG
jgi:ethanolamine utilization protein EutP